jgi:hypothetical protein
MAATEYRRLDVPVKARTRPSGDVVLHVASVGRVVLRRATIAAWHAGTQPRTFRPAGAFTTLLSRALEQAAPQDQVTVRVAADVGVELAALPWEDAVGVRVVRAVSVPARVAAWPLSLPLRFVHAGPRDRFDLETFLRDHLLGSHDNELVDHAVLARTVELSEVEFTVRDLQWPTVDVLHLADVPEVPASVELLSTARADVPGTLGWLSRLTDRLRCRLVVVAPESRGDQSRTRRLLTALAERGGPGSVSVDRAWEPDALRDFYAAIVHDAPFDVAAPAGFGTVVGGTGREGLVRPSRAAIALADPRPMLTDLPVKPFQTPTRSFAVHKPRAGHATMAHLAEFREQLESEIRFEDHEREGILPVGAYVHSLREEASLTVPTQIRIEPDEQRYVNPELGYADPDGSVAPIDQNGGALVLGNPAVLSLAIGPASEVIRVAWTRALLDDIMFLPDEDGVWVEFGVTGIDFSIEGDATQEVWLPRNGLTERALFTVTPRRRDASVLRYCLYVRQTLVQSFKLAATTIPTAGSPVTVRPRTLARRLGLTKAEVGDATWLSRLEYSLTPDPFDASSRDDRSVSIVANQHAGESIVTVKSRDVFGTVQLPGGVGDFVHNARQALEDAATPPVAGADPSDWLYGYGDQTDENRGTTDVLRRDLAAFAEIGWGLYSQLISGKDRQKLNLVLAERPDQIIEVAHTLLPKVIPWALVYDRRYSSNTTADPDGKPYDFGVCPAALPSADGVLPDVECSVDPNCLLTASGSGGRHYCADTVVCANRSWGFRHQVELPAQQAHGGLMPPAAPPKVQAGANVRVGVGMHGGLTFAQAHDTEIRTLVGNACRNTTLAFREYDNNRVRSALQAMLDLDVIYFYCHAEGTQADASLRFRLPDPDALEGRLTPGDLDGEIWANHPIVVLNGCRTAAFSVDALSPFLVTLIRDRQASALLATEIAVWEPLARAFAGEFMAAFLNSNTAGEALLQARRKLLAVNNPLGLSYTLYGVSDLKLATPRPGHALDT